VLLALDTATDAVSIALHDGTDLVAERSLSAARRHVEVLTPEIDALLRTHGFTPDSLTSIAVGVGPGAFTGLRVGLVTARTLAYARGLPCNGVLTLDALAAAALDAGSVGAHESFGVAIDARRREVFWARYEQARRVSDPLASRPEDLVHGGLEGLTVVGDAVERYPGTFAREIAAAPTAAAIARISLRLDDRFEVVEPAPLYVRKPVTPQGRH
jgi:tRNA threonylcarbamoyladenosine biosynthesis protein TsaB